MDAELYSIFSRENLIKIFDLFVGKWIVPRESSQKRKRFSE